jgi:hypothetical protein
MSKIDHFVFFCCQEQYAFFLTVGIDLFYYVELAQTNSSFFFNVFADSPVKARKKTMKKAQTITRNLILRYLFAEQFQT